MTADILLEVLRSRGIRLAPIGDRLRIRAPKGTLTPDLRATISKHKAEILASFRDPETQAAEVAQRLSPDGPGWAAIRSSFLGETVVWVRDETVVLPPEATRLVSYTRTELEILSTSTEKALRLIHQAKK